MNEKFSSILKVCEVLFEKTFGNYKETRLQYFRYYVDKLQKHECDQKRLILYLQEKLLENRVPELKEVFEAIPKIETQLKIEQNVKQLQKQEHRKIIELNCQKQRLGYMFMYRIECTSDSETEKRMIEMSIKTEASDLVEIIETRMTSGLKDVMDTVGGKEVRVGVMKVFHANVLLRKI